jgi:hypothetical protein
VVSCPGESDNSQPQNEGEQMSCRHDLANGTCARCYPNTGKIEPGPEEEYEENLEGPGAVPAAAQATPSRDEVVDLSRIFKDPLTGDTFETFANFFIAEAITYLHDDTLTQIFGNKDKVEKATVCLTVNEVQLPFLKVLRRFYEQWERIVGAEAAKLVEEKFSSRTGEIFDLLDDLHRRLEEVVGKKDE